MLPSLKNDPFVLDMQSLEMQEEEWKERLDIARRASETSPTSAAAISVLPLLPR